jgi:hypothetical protein
LEGVSDQKEIHMNRMKKTAAAGVLAVMAALGTVMVGGGLTGAAVADGHHCC